MSPTTRFPASLEQDSIILIVECLIKIHSNVLCALLQGMRDGISQHDLPILLVDIMLSQGIQTVLKDLLEKPLRDRVFRMYFNNHFENHPDYTIKTRKEWLDEILIYERE